jgi:dipeptidyl-peptidase 4
LSGAFRKMKATTGFCPGHFRILQSPWPSPFLDIYIKFTPLKNQTLSKMKKISFLILIAIFAISNLMAQQSERPDIKGWLDDDYYLQEIVNDEGKAQIWKVRVSNGKAKVYKKASPLTKVNEALPDGFSINQWNSLSTENYNNNIIVQDDNLYYFSFPEGNFKQLTDNEATENNTVFSPDESKIAFTRDHNLFTIDLASGTEKQLTKDGNDLILNGYASWVYWEEIFGRATKYKTFWWSPDSKKIAFLRFDDSAVPEFLIYNSVGTHGEWEKTRYPKVGDPNPGVRLGIVDVETGKIEWIANNHEEDIYIAFPVWTPNSAALTYQVLNRDQDHLEIFSYNLEDNKTKEIYSEEQETWVEFFSDIYYMKDGSGFIIRSDKNGWRNLYYYDLDGNLISQLTNNDWRTKKLLKVNEESKWVYFTGTGEKSINQQLYKVKLDGSQQTALTSYDGYHKPNLSPSGANFIDTYSSFHTPTTIELVDGNGQVIRLIYAMDAPAPEGKELCEVEYFTISTDDGFDLPAYWVLPPDFDATKKYPVIFQIYGGPDHADIRNTYKNPKPRFYAENGIITFVVDHRGSGQFGKKGMNYLHRHLGKWELADYITAVKWLTDHEFIDSTKIGITGGSYGGYMTCLALTKGADYFTDGYASSAVTDWRLYDNVYTERYMDLDTDNKAGYDSTAVMPYADMLKGNLYLAHGDMDDNVHMQNMTQLVNELTNLNKDFQMMIYPGGRHGWGMPKVRHTMREMKEFWIEGFED